MISGRAKAAVALLFALTACTPARAPKPVAPKPSAPKSFVFAGKPRLTVAHRSGDPAVAVGVAIDTAGLADNAPEASVALAALLAARVSPFHGEAHAGWDTVHAYALADGASSAADVVTGALSALSQPVLAEELPIVAKKVARFRGLPPVTADAVAAMACANLPRPSIRRDAPSWGLVELEKLRRAAMDVSRVSVAFLGDSSASLNVLRAYRGAPAFAAGAPRPVRSLPAASIALVPLVASERALRTAPRVTLSIASRSVDRLGSSAEHLSLPDGDLAVRLGSLSPPAKLERIELTLHGDYACLTLEASFHGEALGRGASAAQATLDAGAAVGAVLARSAAEERRAEPARAPASGLHPIGSDVARAAEEAAAWAFLGDDSRPAEDATYLVGELTAAVDDGGAFSRRVGELTLEKPIEVRSRSEPGQPSTWVLLGSPCAGLGETGTTAGASALATLAAGFATKPDPSAPTEPWTTASGAGIIAHADGPNGAVRAARAAVRTFGARLASHALADARRYALGLRSRDDVLAFRTLSDAVFPDGLALFMPFGTHDTLAALSEDAVNERLVALRRGPTRLVVLDASANGSGADAAASVVRAFRDPAAIGATTCEASRNGTLPPVRPGTYALERTTPGPAELWIAQPVSNPSPREREAMHLLATALDGPGGLLARALGEGVAHTTEARIVSTGDTPAGRPTLLIHLVTTQAALDAAALRTVELLAQLSKEALSAQAFAKTEEALAWGRRARLRDPRARLVDLFVGEPATRPSPNPAITPLDLARLAERVLRVDDRVVVALRARQTP